MVDTKITDLADITPAVGDELVVNDVSGPNTDGKITVGEILDIINGDINVSATGAATFGSGVIVNADVNASAAIAYSKLNLTGAVLDADLAGSITPSKITGTAAVQTDNLSVFAATTSAQLAGVISDETGSGALVFATSPTFVTPVLGTPTSGALTNCTSIPAAQLSGIIPDANMPNLTGDVTTSEGAVATTIAAGAVDDAMMNTTDDAMLAVIPFVIDGGGSAITTGIKGDIPVGFNCTIERVEILADQSGAIKIDIWKDTYANFPPTDADSITASATPEIAASGTKDEDETLTGWTTTISKGDILRFNVDSITTIERATIALRVRKT